MKHLQEKIGVVASNFASQTTFCCFVTGISPLALRNDTMIIYFRTQVNKKFNGVPTK